MSAIPVVYLLCSSAIIDITACFCNCELPVIALNVFYFTVLMRSLICLAVVNCTDLALSVLFTCFNVLPNIFAVMNCSVLALNAVLCSGLLALIISYVHYSDKFVQKPVRRVHVK